MNTKLLDKGLVSDSFDNGIPDSSQDKNFSHTDIAERVIRMCNAVEESSCQVRKAEVHLRNSITMPSIATPTKELDTSAAHNIQRLKNGPNGTIEKLVSL